MIPHAALLLSCSGYEVVERSLERTSHQEGRALGTHRACAPFHPSRQIHAAMVTHSLPAAPPRPPRRPCTSLRLCAMHEPDGPDWTYWTRSHTITTGNALSDRDARCVLQSCRAAEAHSEICPGVRTGTLAPSKSNEDNGLPLCWRPGFALPARIPYACTVTAPQSIEAQWRFANSMDESLCCME